MLICGTEGDIAVAHGRLTSPAPPVSRRMSLYKIIQDGYQKIRLETLIRDIKQKTFYS